MGLMLVEEALRLAREEELDLVEVAPDADPPVCKILDYGKFKYQQKKKAHQARAKAKVTHVKELRLRPKIEDHDFMTKVKKARSFLEDGDRLQLNMLFRGREMAHLELGKEVLERFVEEVSDIAQVEKQANLQGRRMTLNLAPRKH